MLKWWSRPAKAYEWVILFVLWALVQTTVSVRLLSGFWLWEVL